MKCQIYLGISEVPPNFCIRKADTKDSANRMKCQIYLGISAQKRMAIPNVAPSRFTEGYTKASQPVRRCMAFRV